jgi:hypothetical protein
LNRLKSICLERTYDAVYPKKERKLKTPVIRDVFVPGLFLSLTQNSLKIKRLKSFIYNFYSFLFHTRFNDKSLFRATLKNMGKNNNKIELSEEEAVKVVCENYFAIKM